MKTVQTSRARSTGTLVDLVDREDDHDGQRWETVCVAHGGVCSHDTRRLARDWMAAPDQWCEDCMYGEGTLAGTRETEA